MNITTDFQTAKPTKKSWSGVFGYSPDQPSQLAFLGEMFAVMSIKSDIEYDLANIANLLQDELQAAYFAPVKAVANMAHFEKSIKAVSKRLEQIMDREQQLAQTGIDFEMLVTVIREGFLFMAAVGESKIVVARGADAAEISSVLIDPEMEGFARTGSLQLEPNDRLMLLTSDAFTQIQQAGAQSALDEFSLSRINLSQGSVVQIGYELDDSFAQQAQAEPEAELEPEEIEEEDEAEEAIPEVVPSRLKQSQPEEESQEYFEDEQEKPNQFKELVAKANSGVGSLITSVRLKLMRKPAEDEYQDEEVEEDDQAEQLESDDQVAYKDVRENGSDRLAQVKDKMQQLSSNAHPLMVKAIKSGGELLTKAKDTIKDLRNGKPGSRETYVRGGKKPGFSIETKWKVLGAVLIVAVIIVIWGVRQTIIDNDRRAYEQSITDKISQYEKQLEDLAAKANLDSIGGNDSAAVEQDLNEFDQLAKQAEDLKSKQIGVARLDAVIAGVQQEKDTLLKVNAFSQPQIITDLAINFQGVNSTNLEYSNGSLFVTDEGRGVIYKMGTSLNATVENFVTGLVKPKYLSVQKDGDLVFIDAASDSIVGVVDIDTGAVKRQPGLTASVIGQITTMFVWPFNDTMYTINTARRAVIKRAAAAGSFALGDGDEWRKDENFANANDIAVDGSIYVLIPGTGIKRYWGGQPASFSLRGLTNQDELAMKNITGFELTSSRLYALDRVNSRVLVFTLKNPANAVYEYKEQIVYRGSDQIFKDLKDIEIASGPQGERIFVLDGSKVLRIDK